MAICIGSIITRMSAVTLPNTRACIRAPMSIITIEKIFSAFVLAAKVMFACVVVDFLERNIVSLICGETR